MAEVTELAKRRVEEIVSFFEINADVKVTETPEAIELEILNNEASARIIGTRGETLRSIEHLVNMMVKRATTERVRVNLDVAGYKKARDAGLEKMAQEAAERVLANGVEEELRPMTPAERRVVHLALKEIEGITSDSRGEDPKRFIVVQKAD
ncbi:MAG: R3H domain-containing nucleic acid-binding protein [Candidatus Saccharibacteria bacterium]